MNAPEFAEPTALVLIRLSAACKPSPWGEGAPVRTLGRMRGDDRAVSFLAGGFRRLRAASSFAHGGKGTKTPPGTAQDERSALIFAFPRTPFTGVTP